MSQRPNAARGSSANRRRPPPGGFSTGRTLQASVSSSTYRRRSTAATRPTDTFARSLQVPEDHAETASVDYDLEDLFAESEEPVVVSRSNTESLATAKLNALSMQRTDAYGNVQPTPTLRQMIGFFLDTSAVGRRWDQIDALLNFALCAIHVYSTTKLKKGHLGVPDHALYAEAALGFALLVQFLPRYFLAPDPLEYLRSLFSVITLITAFTPMAVVANIYLDPAVKHETFMSAGVWVFLYPVVFWRLQPALLRCLVPIKNVYHMSPMMRNVMRALTTVFTTVLAITVLTHTMVYMQNKDKNGEIQGFDEAFFFIAVSAITGLSSDIEPDTWFTRTIVLFVMFIGIFWLPPRVSEMLSLWQDRSPWPAEFEAESNQSHVLLIGDLHYTTLFEFLREFFCEDHGFTTVNTVVVVMSETSPSKEIAELLTDPSYVNRVKFVLGSPTSFSQLSKVQADRAQAIFLLSSKAAGADAEKEDAAKVMIALAIRKYLRTRGDAKRPVPIYAQVLLPETTLHLDYLTDHVICIEELRQGLLAQSVMVPGVASLLQLLTTSIPDNTTHQLVRAAQRSKQEWLAEYAESMSHEIYGTKLAQMFVGQKFHKVSQTIFARTGATLFALHTSDDKILISPRDYEIKGDETGFVIASDSLVSTEIAYLQEEAAVNVDSDGEDEQTPLIPGINISATKDAAKQISGSPLQKAAVIAETTMKTKVPFGKNVMDTLVVDVMESSAAEESDHGSVRSGKSVVSQHLEDLIDLGHTGKLGQLVGDLAHITVGAEDASSGKGKEPEESKAEETKVATKRAPLLFDPALQKPTEDAEAPKPDSPSPPALAPSKTLKGTLKGASSATLLTKPTTPVTPTVDGLPGDLAGHLVVCDTSGEFPSNIIYLVSCIRAAAASEITSVAETDEHNGKQPSSRFASLYEQISRSYNLPTAEPEKPGFSNNLPIVILSPASPGGAQAEDLKRFGNIYIVEGSPLSRADLARVRIHTAGSGIVLANREESLSAAADASKNASLASSDTSATATADAPALLSVLNIEALTYTNDEFFLSVEFIHRENMQFVGDTETIRINEVYAQAFLRPSFMAGRVYAPVMLDTLICQAYYNEFIPDLMQRLIFSHGNVVHALGTAKLQAAGIEGLVYEEGQGVEDSGHVFQVEVPERFYGRTYASLFAYCCFKHAAVPIGLYRTVTYHRQPLWYVMPNPSPKNVLRQSDRVYVIAAARPVLQ